MVKYEKRYLQLVIKCKQTAETETKCKQTFEVSTEIVNKQQNFKMKSKQTASKCKQTAAEIPTILFGQKMEFCHSVHNIPKKGVFTLSWVEVESVGAEGLKKERKY